jgi:hypothetical protein
LGVVWGASWNFNVFLYYLKYENEFQNPKNFQQTISLFPKQSTLVECIEIYDDFILTTLFASSLVVARGRSKYIFDVG